MNRYGAATGKKGYQELLVIQSIDDEVVNVTATKEAYECACMAGSTVHLSLYPGLTHDASLPASAPEWLHWLDNQFMGVKTPNANKCTVERRVPLLDTLS